MGRRGNDRQICGFAKDDLGSPDGTIILGEIGFVKKGLESIDVGKQYCETIEKVNNCQAWMFAAHVSEPGYTLVDKRPFISEKWFTDGFLDRRPKCKQPKETVFQVCAHRFDIWDQCDGILLQFLWIGSSQRGSEAVVSAIRVMKMNTFAFNEFSPGKPRILMDNGPCGADLSAANAGRRFSAFIHG